MRRLCRSVTVVALLAALWVGCGSIGSQTEDSLVLQFLHFDNTGLTQTDAVRETSADIDIIVDCCTFAPDGSCSSIEPFQQTIINAIFQNNEATDIHLTGYTVDVGPTSGVGIFPGVLSLNIRGGRCLGLDATCATDSDCLVGGTVVTGACQHTETTASGILLFDIDTKLHVLPGTYNVLITFFGSDPNQSFKVSTNYVARFDDFINCTTTGTGGH
jgi:hypothetical protein